MTADQVGQEGLQAELDAVLVEVHRAEDRVRATAESMGIDPHVLLDHRGHSVLAPLLIARAQVLVAIANLQGGSG